MWDKRYKDYPRDKPLIKYEVEPSRGIIGCQMHELNGWGNELHIPIKKKKRGFFQVLFEEIFNKFKK